MNLKNKIIVITGSSKGLGKAIASEFLNEGAKVIVNARLKKELQDLSKEMNVITFAGDVTKEKDMQKLADFAVKKFRKIDVWVNNAGVNVANVPIEKMDSQQAHQLMEVNFFGTFYGSRSVMKVMKKQKSGIIINIISMSALFGRPFSSTYSSSKWAVRGFTEALRMDLESKNVSVIAVYPGGIKTNLFAKVKRPADFKDYMEPSYVAEKIVQNLKSQKPKEELIINKK